MTNLHLLGTRVGVRLATRASLIPVLHVRDRGVLPIFARPLLPPTNTAYSSLVQVLLDCSALQPGCISAITRDLILEGSEVFIENREFWGSIGTLNSAVSTYEAHLGPKSGVRGAVCCGL